MSENYQTVFENLPYSIKGFVLYNAAEDFYTIVLNCRFSYESMKKTLVSISVKGRLEPIKVSNKFSVLIDYAYQGIAMENVIKTIREANPKRIVVVFGCGGNRSKQRRYDCGKIAGELADFAVLIEELDCMMTPSLHDRFACAVIKAEIHHAEVIVDILILARVDVSLPRFGLIEKDRAVILSADDILGICRREIP